MLHSDFHYQKKYVFGGIEILIAQLTAALYFGLFTSFILYSNRPVSATYTISTSLILYVVYAILTSVCAYSGRSFIGIIRIVSILLAMIMAIVSIIIAEYTPGDGQSEGAKMYYMVVVILVTAIASLVSSWYSYQYYVAIENENLIVGGYKKNGYTQLQKVVVSDDRDLPIEQQMIDSPILTHSDFVKSENFRKKQSSKKNVHDASEFTVQPLFSLSNLK